MALGGLGWSWVMIFSKYTLDADVQALMASADGKRLWGVPDRRCHRQWVAGQNFPFKRWLLRLY
tara:strand:+ start:628 stop:819 length:192 start_codon:yes stop_codon:yes gene_type:complete